MCVAQAVAVRRCRFGEEACGADEDHGGGCARPLRRCCAGRSVAELQAEGDEAWAAADMPAAVHCYERAMALAEATPGAAGPPAPPSWASETLYWRECAAGVVSARGMVLTSPGAQKMCTRWRV